MGLRVIFTKWAWAYDGDGAQSPKALLIIIIIIINGYYYYYYY